MPVVKNPIPLSEDFIPLNIVDREAERSCIRQLATMIETHGLANYSLYIHGWIGVGKTVVTRVVLAGLKNVKYKYLRLLTKRETTKRVVERLFERGLSPNADYLAMLRNYVNTSKIQLLVFDEVTPENVKAISPILHILSRETHCSSILISRYVDIENHIPRDTLSSLRLRRLYFPPYTKDQLYEILKQRVELALYPNAISRDELDRIAEYASVYGSARTALDILNFCCSHAEAAGSGRITMDMVETAITEAEDEMFMRKIRTLPDHYKHLLHVMLKLSKSFGNLIPYHVAYRRWSMKYPLSKRTFRNIVKSLKSEGIVTTTRVGKGRGRGASFYLSFGPDISEVLERCEW